MGVGNKTIGRGLVVMGPKGKLEVIDVSKPLETHVVSFVEMVCIVGSLDFPQWKSGMSIHLSLLFFPQPRVVRSQL